MDAALNVANEIAGLALEPSPIERLGGDSDLDDQIVGEVLRRDFAALFPPQTDQGVFVRAHNDPGVRAANEAATVAMGRDKRGHGFLL